MIRRIACAALVALSLAAGTAPATAQEPTPAAQTPDATQALRGTVQSLTDDGTPPASSRAFWHVVLAYGFTGISVFGYAVVMGRRYRKLATHPD